MEFSEGIKIKAHLHGKKIDEVLVPVERGKGKAKLKRFHDGLRNLLYIFVIFVRLRLELKC
jgi:hypothetical protein